MYETVAVAIKINERGETLTSSVVDDVFYILQKCARRASETGEKCQCTRLQIITFESLLRMSVNPSSETSASSC